MRGRSSWRYALAAAVAATFSWNIAHLLFGHPKPLFAVVTSVVCLAPGLPNHFKQATGLLLGVITGMIIGELVFYIPDILPMFRLAIAAFFALFIASLYGRPPVVVVQSGISAILVQVLGAQNAGPERMLDVITGATIGLIFSQIILTPDPIKQIDNAASNLLNELEKGLFACKAAANKNDAEKAESAFHKLATARARVVGVDSILDTVKDDVKWSIRGRLASHEVTKIIKRYDRHIIRLYAATLLFSDSLFRALRDEPEGKPHDMDKRIDDLIMTLKAWRDGKLLEDTHKIYDESNFCDKWLSCNNNLYAVFEAIFALNQYSDKRTLDKIKSQK